MTADRLRQAARVLRERAEAATPGPWLTHDEDGDPYIAPPATGALLITAHPLEVARANAAYIATMHPGVGLALADWLEAEGKVYYTPDGVGSADPVTRAAHRLADLILGGGPDA